MYIAVTCLPCTQAAKIPACLLLAGTQLAAGQCRLLMLGGSHTPCVHCLASSQNPQALANSLGMAGLL